MYYFIKSFLTYDEFLFSRFIY